MMAATQKVRRGGIACSAINCTNRKYKCPEKSFFSFPKDEARCKDWVQRSRRLDLLGKDVTKLYRIYYLCCDHFEDSQFMNANEKNRLIWSAVPSLFQVPNPPPLVTSKRRLLTRKTTEKQGPPAKKIKLIEATKEITSICKEELPTTSEMSPKKKALTREKKRWQNKFYRQKKKAEKCYQNIQKISDKEKKQKLIKELSDYLSGPALEFVSSRIHMEKKRKMNWSDRDKCVALSLYHTSPKAYRVVKKIFALPSLSTLRRAMRKVKVYPGFCENILNALKEKLLVMPQGSNVCALVFDEMVIKEQVQYNIERDEVEGLEDFGTEGKTHLVANHATVFMLKGLLTGWKQAIGYVLSSGPIDSSRLSNLIVEGLNRIQEKGLKIKVLIADQGSNNRKVLERLHGVSKDRPYIVHNNEKIFVMYDPPHLLKNIRNNLKKTGYSVGGIEVSWRHIETFFKIDRQNRFRMAHKLTHRHIYLPPFASLRVKFAAQVLSHTVAAGLSTLVQLNALPPEADETANFAENFDLLFNTFNSATCTASQKMRHAFSETSGHREFLHQILPWLKTLQSNSSRTLPCIDGWIMDIHALLSLWEDLHTNYGFKYLFTKRLNQDSVENLFSVLRGKGGNRDNPTAKEFRQALRAAMVDAILIQSDRSNCEEDSDKFLLTLTTYCGHDSHSQSLSVSETEQQIVGADMDTELKWLIANPCPQSKDPLHTNSKDVVLFYIAGYIARKVSAKTCQACQLLLRGTLSGDPRELFLKQKQYDDLHSEGLVVPSEELFIVIKQLDKSYEKRVKHCVYKTNVRTSLLQEMEKDLGVNRLHCPLSGQSDDPCQLQSLVMRLFVNVSFHFTLKENSRLFSAPSEKRNRKILPTPPFVSYRNKAVRAGLSSNKSGYIFLIIKI